jgi:alginate O-acetyltransferase complex protein AlgJ
VSRQNAIRLLFAVLAIGFFATPIAARVLGVTAESFENRRFAEAPKLSQGWDTFQQTGRFLTDRMPLRAQAVRANTRIWTDLFGTTPRYASRDATGEDGALPFAGSTDRAGDEGAGAAAQTAQQVLPGRDGWLYLQGELDRACAPIVPLPEALDRWAALVATVRASGRRAVALVPPDKASVYPEHLPDDFPNASCAAAGKRAIWRLLERSARRTGVMPLRAPLLVRKRRERELLYTRKDSHWNTVGSLELVRAALAAAGGGIAIAPGEVVDAGEGTYTGDLTTLLGAPESDTRPSREIARRAVAPLVPGRTLLVKDSFGDAPGAQLMPYFEDLRLLGWFGTPMKQVAREVRLADMVVFETVEREFTFRAAPGDVVDQLTVALRKSLDGP